MSEPRDSLVFFTDRDLGARFPGIRRDAGLNVRPHGDLFPPDCPDDVWLEAVGKQGWIAVSHDTRIRYKPNELAAVVRHGVRLLVVIGKVPFPQLAKHFVATVPRIAAFIEQHSAPWIPRSIGPHQLSLPRMKGIRKRLALVPSRESLRAPSGLVGTYLCQSFARPNSRCEV